MDCHRHGPPNPAADVFLGSSVYLCISPLHSLSLPLLPLPLYVSLCLFVFLLAPARISLPLPLSIPLHLLPVPLNLPLPSFIYCPCLSPSPSLSLCVSEYYVNCRWFNYFGVFSVVIDCGEPQDLANASLTFTSTTFSHSANYSCERGFWLRRDTRQITTWCKDSGNWTKINHTCKGTWFY